VAIQGGDDEDGEGGGSDIGALLGNLGPLLGGLSGVSNLFVIYFRSILVYDTVVSVYQYFGGIC
jgi:hypothetical protein